MNSHRSWLVAALAAGLAVGIVATGQAAPTVVRFEQQIYFVTGPGDMVLARVVIDSNPETTRDDPVLLGLFSMGFKTTYNSAKATVAGPSDAIVAPALDHFGFAPGAYKQVEPGLVGLKGNINVFDDPLQPYMGTILGQIKFTNLASAVDSYPLNLDFFRTVGPNEQLFLDGQGNVLDADIVFIPSEVVVVPEPSGALLFGVAIGGVGCLLWRARPRSCRLRKN